MTTVSLINASDLSGDALVVATSPGRGKRGPAHVHTAHLGLGSAAARKVADAITALGATGKPGDVVRVPGAVAGVSASVILATGVGTIDLDAESAQATAALRDAAAVAVRALAGSKRVVLGLPASTSAHVGAIAEGAVLGAYQFSHFKSSRPEKGPVRTAAIVVSDPRATDVREAVARAQIVAAATTFARDLINTPASHLHPADLADAAVETLAELPVDVEVLDEEALVDGGYGGIVGVGQGAADPPRLVRMQYRVKGASTHVALVGKGITFDTGGYSLKPPASMLGMQADMSGAAAVIAAMRAVAELGLPINVTAYAACAENMVSGTAQRPTDVITMFGGKTVEVNNTDAEGRLVMADALVRCGEDKPDIVIDIATLTGAIVLSLGQRTAGIFCSDDDLASTLIQSGEHAGEPFWRMPFIEHLRPSLDSSIADIANVGERMGGSIVAALFLREFVPSGTAWAHLDIAGPAFNDNSPYGHVGKGGAGFAVRTLVQALETLSRS